MPAPADWLSWSIDRKRLYRAFLALEAKRARLRPKQIPGDNYLTVACGGRGAGKSLTGSRWLARMLVENDPAEWAVLAPTFAAARNVCIEGSTGLLNALGLQGAARKRAWNRSLGELYWAGHVVRIDSLEDGALRVQGKNLAGAWVDEFSLVREKPALMAWDESLLPAVRVAPARLLVTMTPYPKRQTKKLLRDPTADVRFMSTWENEANLPAHVVEQLRKRYAGTRLGRMMLEGVMIEDAEGALVRRAWIEAGAEMPPLEGAVHERVVALDPGGQDAQALCVMSRTMDQRLHVERAEVYVQPPASAGRPEEGAATGYLRHAVRLAQAGNATIIVEKNHGGDYLVELLRAVMAELGVIVPTRVVWASAGKRARAEPVAHLVETGRIGWPMVDSFDLAELGDQWCSWDGTGDSPHLVDAMVWAGHALTGGLAITGADDLALLAAVPFS